MMGSGALLQRIRHFPSRLLPKDKSDVNIISCVSFPFKQYRTKKKGWFKQGKGSRANPQKRLQHLAAGTAGAAAPQGAGYGAVISRAAGQSTSTLPPIQRFFICRFRWRLEDLSNCRAYVLNNKLKSIILATEYKTVFCRC